MRSLTVGWGFRAQAQAPAFADCWQQACAQLPALADATHRVCMVVLESRCSTDACRRLIACIEPILPNVVWRCAPDSAIRAVVTPHESARLQQRFGTGSVCEALALQASSGWGIESIDRQCEREMRHTCQSQQAAANALPRATMPITDPRQAVRLLLPRIVSSDRHATLAVAELAQPADAFESGDFS